ncbi:ATP-binding protein [Streptomyces sp. NA04227]|uniref:ATP-binding protein n=1 Tax=Streptomyces sp. NA04227 TaxID=2742136 RepID=UPI001590591C|nr:ATP-binding protein [Streptomyces sp. NA04227]QKW06709.1 ATP-binding protein [Streptomyces sp. NA04227]
MRFTANVKAVALARHQVERTLIAWQLSTPDIERAVLVTSELATNAVQHGRVPDRLFEVRLTVEPNGGLLLEVSDASSRVPEHVHAAPEDESGRGLALVAALADEFGHRPREYVGKTVWAKFRLA